ncbi:protein FAM107B isoform X1 [Glossina fuscipes]|uniref:Protein FAM107B isoform X1 n=3 Tax=Glossina TaxID=7393 RepID=A0A8U0WL68_9MUSC|nr:protein FAM107B isoform X1 [Glossina fuscipes]KAI9584193.1 hypothetical protein GQX74_010528 [Glossina fuscipes]
MNKSHISTDILNRMKAFESTDSEALNRLPIVPLSLENEQEKTATIGPPTGIMMSSPPSGVQTDAEGLILPKKLINPCLESTDRKQLHRELKFTTKMGINVLNQKSELQRAYEKQREKQLQQQQHDQHSPTIGLKGELSRVIMERAQKHEQARQQETENDEDKQYVNPEYLNIKAKLKQTTDFK